MSKKKDSMWSDATVEIEDSASLSMPILLYSRVLVKGDRREYTGTVTALGLSPSTMMTLYVRVEPDSFWGFPAWEYFVNVYLLEE